MELGGSWCYRGLWLVPYGTSQASQLHVNPPNLGSQTLRLQRGAAPFTLRVLFARVDAALTLQLNGHCKRLDEDSFLSTAIQMIIC